MLKSSSLKTALLMHKYSEKSSHTWNEKMNSMEKVVAGKGNDGPMERQYTIFQQ